MRYNVDYDKQKSTYQRLTGAFNSFLLTLSLRVMSNIDTVLALVFFFVTVTVLSTVVAQSANQNIPENT